jgi:hypothetical protein
MLRHWLTDRRGQVELTADLFTKVPFWFLVTFILTLCLVGIRQAGLASQAHLVARAAGSADVAASQRVAHQHAATWGLPPDAAVVTVDADRRLVHLTWAFDWRSLGLGRTFGFGVHETERLEGFYGGPAGSGP